VNFDKSQPESAHKQNFSVTIRLQRTMIPMVHACNPSCSGGRQAHEDKGSKPVLANTL
jgi:hypothetical protein